MSNSTGPKKSTAMRILILVIAGIMMLGAAALPFLK